ncbi:MAG TPA: sigma-70 family RNA polymerase sigma factor [Armatimonadota bacterium]|jgi:RNA polymerase sigma-70 factor (ECF subfamily)
MKAPIVHAVAQGDVTDAELVRRAKDGDDRAYEALFSRHQRRIYSIVYGMLRNEADASDATQEAFVRAYRSLPRLEAEGAFGGWLAQIAVNICRDILKRPRLVARSLDEPMGDEDSEYKLEIPDWSDSPERASMNQELTDVVNRAIGTLSPDHRTVVTMHHMEGMDVLQIAEALGISEGTVKSRLSRARAELRRKLGHYVDFGE